jgi:hypothetical protein
MKLIVCLGKPHGLVEERTEAWLALGSQPLPAKGSKPDHPQLTGLEPLSNHLKNADPQTHPGPLNLSLQIEDPQL